MITCIDMEDKQLLHMGCPVAAVPECQTNPPRRILVVEDNDEVRHLNAGMLEQSGYEVVAVEDGAAAWDKLQCAHYDLVVTDNDMPKVSGFQLIEMIYTSGVVLPVIMATGSLPKEFNRSPWLLPAALLLKPYSIHELLAAVQNVLRTVFP